MFPVPSIFLYNPNLIIFRKLHHEFLPLQSQSNAPPPGAKGSSVPLQRVYVLFGFGRDRRPGKTPEIHEPKPVQSF